MAKEINIFDQEIEKVDVCAPQEESTEENPLELPVLKMPKPPKTTTQMSFPGFEQLTIAQPVDMATNMRLHVKRVVEALLFSSHEPLPFKKIKEITDTIHEFPPRVIKSILENLQDEYFSQQRAFRLEEIAQGY